MRARSRGRVGCLSDYAAGDTAWWADRLPTLQHSTIGLVTCYPGHLAIAVSTRILISACGPGVWP